MTTSRFDLEKLAASPLHGDISHLFQTQGWRDWPTDAQLNALLSDEIKTASGQALVFTSNRTAGDDGAIAYESQIDLSGQIPIRPQQWHDLFNALMWIQFPATKAALNGVHRRELVHTSSTRSLRRDAVTLMDECGVLLAVSDPRFTQAHLAHDWDTLFVQTRQFWGTQIVPMIVGHGLYEQCLSPYIGLTAKALHVPMPSEFFSAAPDEQRRQLDLALAAAINADTAVLTTAELLPLPVLGVPDWWDANRDPAFYANRRYFRKRARSRPASAAEK